jgi:manganese transport system substrate-binding protein
MGAVALAGCQSSAATVNNDDELVVVTTFTIMADMARNVTGDRARVESITQPGAEIHGYEPTASDVIRASDADIVLHNGMGLEAWFDDFIAQIDAPQVVLTDAISPLFIAGSADAAPNPHAWMSPDNGALYVRAIQDALTDADPDGADIYAANADAYIAQIAAVGKDLTAALDTIPAERRVLITCEGAFSYLAAEAGLDEVYLWPVNAESQSTAQSVRAAIETVREREVPAVFCESTVSQAGMDQVAKESGATFAGVLYVDSLSAADGPVPSYLDLLEINAQTIVDGLTGATP